MIEDKKQREFLLASLQTHAALQEVIGEWLPITQKRKLDEVVEHWRDPLDESLVRLTPEGGSRRNWLDTVGNGSQSVRDGLTACHYHVSRIEQIENEVIEFCEARGEIFREGHDVNFRIPSLSAEYAALQFALRRTLDYMAITVAAFFKNESASFRRLDRSVQGKPPIGVSEAVVQHLAETDMSSILGTAEGHSVRDQLAHQQAVESAWFGVQRFQGSVRIRYSSEVEDITTGDEFGDDEFLTTPHRGRDLSRAVAAKLSLAEGMIFCLYADLHLLEVKD